MAIKKPKLVALVAGGVAVVALVGLLAWQPWKPKADGAAAQTAAPGGPGGAGGPGRPGGPGGPGGRGGAPEIAVASVSTRSFAKHIEALGTLEPRERVDLTANAAERVTAVFFEDGQRVRQGTTLITLAAEEERALLESAQATQADNQRTFERNERLSNDGAVSSQELQRSRAAAEASAGTVRSIQARLRDRVIVAPFSGVLGFRQVSTGAYVAPGQVVATLIDDSEMRLEFGVPSIFLTQTSRGMRILATTADLAGQTFEGRVTSIDNAIDPVTRAFKVRATLPNTRGQLRAGMFMNVALLSTEHDGLSVPEISVVSEGDKTYAFVVQRGEQGMRAVKTEIQVGVRERGVVEVLSGLNEGDQVVTDGILKVRPNSPVRIQQPGGAGGRPGGPTAGQSPQGGRGQSAPTAHEQQGQGAGAPRVAEGDASADRAALRQ
jgi:membrane fusion protein (multidrug efflux system)